MPRIKLIDRIMPTYTRGEEKFNMVSHIVGGGVGILTLIACVIVAAYFGNGWGVVSGAIYGFTMILLYTMSSIYHGLKHDMGKRVFRVIDHCSIFLLIAGTYTPLTLVSLRLQDPVLAWIIFGVVWGAAILGVTLNSIDLKKYRVFSMICYLGMGWCMFIAINPMLKALPMNKGFGLIIAGGISYTIGAILYGVGKKIKYMHSVFHIFVVIASILHSVCIAVYVMPIVK